MLLPTLLPHDILQQFILLSFTLHLAQLPDHGWVLDIGHLFNHLEEVTLVYEELLTFLSEVHLSRVCADKSVKVSIEVLGI